MAIIINKPLPEFEAVATGGIQVSNTSHLGKTLVLYFYRRAAPRKRKPSATATTILSPLARPSSVYAATTWIHTTASRKSWNCPLS